MGEPDSLSDDVPVADAAEQEQEITPVPPSAIRTDLAMEAATPDWQEPLQEVIGAEEHDREDYRDGDGEA